MYGISIGPALPSNGKPVTFKLDFQINQTHSLQMVASSGIWTPETTPNFQKP
jgi:hypothetical protein